FLLAFWRRKRHNPIEARSWGLSAIELAPQPVCAGSGALSVTGLWWLDAQVEREPAASELESNTPHCLLSFLKRSALRTRGVSHFTPKSFSSKPVEFASADAERFNVGITAENRVDVGHKVLLSPTRHAMLFELISDLCGRDSLRELAQHDADCLS